MTYTTLLIDVDETLYASSCGVWEAISKRMEQYMHDRLNLTWDEIPALRRLLYQTYGTTLRGLQEKGPIDTRDFLDYVHDVPLDQLLQPDLALRDVLERYACQRRVIFTNGDRYHAGRVIDRLQLAGCFDQVIDIYDLAPYCKPMSEAFQIALEKIGASSSAECVFVDDSPRNLTAARALGFFTIQVGQPKPGFSHPSVAAHAIIPRLHDLPAVLDPLMAA